MNDKYLDYFTLHYYEKYWYSHYGKQTPEFPRTLNTLALTSSDNQSQRWIPVLKIKLLWEWFGEAKRGLQHFFLQETQQPTLLFLFFPQRVKDEADTPNRDRISISGGSLRQRRKPSGHGGLVNEQVIQYSLCWV